MKRILIVILIISTLLITGCKSSKNEENEFKRVINTYYNSYVKNKIEGLDVLEVSLVWLKPWIRNIFHIVPWANYGHCDNLSSPNTTVFLRYIFPKSLLFSLSRIKGVLCWLPLHRASLYEVEANGWQRSVIRR